MRATLPRFWLSENLPIPQVHATIVTADLDVYFITAQILLTVIQNDRSWDPCDASHRTVEQEQFSARDQHKGCLLRCNIIPTGFGGSSRIPNTAKPQMRTHLSGVHSEAE